MDNLLQQGITAYKSGKRDEARKIFITVVKQSPDSKSAWGWMYQVSNNDKERIHCLKQILRVNPSSEKAKQRLDSLTGQDFPFEQPQKDMPLEKSRKDVPPEQPSVPPQRKAPREKKKGGGVLVTLILVVICCLVAFIAIPSNPTILSIITNVFNSGGIDIGGVIKPPLANAIIGTWCNIVTPSYEIPTCFTFSKGGLMEYSGFDSGGFPDHFQGNYAVVDNTSIRVDDPRPLGEGSFVCTDAQINDDQLMFCGTIYYNIASAKVSQTQTEIINIHGTAAQGTQQIINMTAAVRETQVAANGLLAAQEAQMILVPAGEFIMGDNTSSETPVLTVTLPDYYIDPYEVTNAEYKNCVNSGGCATPNRTDYYNSPGFERYPVIWVSRSMAEDFCSWRYARLPTEAEWEKAARGTDGRSYPWGEGIDCDKANYQPSCVGDITYVGSYESGKSPYGVYDMAGNAAEWVFALSSDQFDSMRYGVLRGSSWYHEDVDARSANRSWHESNQVWGDVGFRCARSPSATDLPASVEVSQTQTMIVNVHKTAVQSTQETNMTATVVANTTAIAVEKKKMMTLISAGDFTMGSNNGHSDEAPAHNVYLPDYYIDQTEVTNADYKHCVDAGICALPYLTRFEYQDGFLYDFSFPEFNDYPVIHVSWDMAKAYCEWQGARLPTEAEWEKAARGTDGRTYPWGEDISCDRVNYYNKNDNGYCITKTTIVGSYDSGKSPYGVYDMAGNVWEWVNDWYDKNYYQNSPSFNPQGPDTGQDHVLRGGGLAGSTPDKLQTTYRGINIPSYVGGDYGFGFRCARDANP